MGCCEQKSKNQTMESIFNKFPIRKITIEDFMKNFNQDDNLYISENKYQELINNYLLTKTDDSVILNDYWFEFYNDLKSEEKSFYIQFCLSLLCSYDMKEGSIEKDLEILKKMLYNYSITNSRICVSEKENNKEFYFLKKEMVKIATKYVELITIKTIPHFKYFWYDSEQFEIEKKNEWSENTIDHFVMKYFFENLEENPDKKQFIEVDEFFKENLYKLRNVSQIREDFANYTKKHIGEKEFEFTANGGKVTVYSAPGSFI